MQQVREDPTGAMAIDSGSSSNNNNINQRNSSTSTINYQRYIVYLIALLFGTLICTYIAYFTIQTESSNNVIIIKNNNNNGNNGNYGNNGNGVTVKEEEIISKSKSKSKGSTQHNNDAQPENMEEVGLEIQQQEEEEKDTETDDAATSIPPNQTKKANNNNNKNNNNNNKKQNNAQQETTEGGLEAIEEEEEEVVNSETTTTADDAETTTVPLSKEEEVNNEVAKQGTTKKSSSAMIPTTTTTTTTKSQGNGLIKTTFDVDELCGNVPERPSPIDYEHKHFECGQKRLQDEYGISIVLDYVEVNPDTGVGSISISMCRPNCFPMFNASDILLWVRFRSSEGVLFAIYPQPVDCRSWISEFTLPVVIEGGGSSPSYQIDVMTIWLHGHPNSWTSSNSKVYQQNTVWEGTRYDYNKFRIHWESINLARWMGCEDFCSEFSRCTHWSENKGAGPFVQSKGRCMMFTNVTGTSKSKGVISGYYPETEHRVNYLGGLAKYTFIEDDRSACRELAHVLGSPTILNIPPTTTTKKKKKKKNNNNNSKNKNDLSSLSKLPWCGAGDITGREAKEIKDQGFWALASAVYPELKNDNCPDACDSPQHLAKEKDETTCMPEDTLQGICAFNDVASTKNGDLIGAFNTPEPTVKELAWVERDCRYRLGDGELFQQCFKDKNFDLLYTEAFFSYEFYDRWKFGQNNNMEAGSVSPKGLRKQWQDRTNSDEGKPIKAVVVIHVWQKMKDILYKKHKFEVENFVGPVSKQIKEWKDAMESEEGWLSKDSVFIVSLASAMHVQTGAPHYTHEAAEYYNEIARKLYGDAGWYVLDTMAISRARADHRMISEWYGGGGGKEGACEKWKCSGSGVLFAMTNVVYNIICT